MKTDLFQSCGRCWVFQICWHIECSTFRAPSFRIWNSLIGIPSPPLVLFIVMLLKAHLTSHSRMSGSRWVITSLWSSESRRSFWYSYSVNSCHLFLICSASVRSIPFLSFIEPIFACKVPLPFLFCCFPLFLCIDHRGRHFSWLFFGTLHSNGNIFPLLFASLLFTAICRDLRDLRNICIAEETREFISIHTNKS